ncbi:hypothetical protein, partial [Nocardia abscessus]|uniref:hypothetical protein n=1 Tax=Nocardia abscessus TaxID=120957 RepID=UPI002454E189
MARVTVSPAEVCRASASAVLAWECQRIDLEGGAIQMVTSELRFAAEHWTTAADPEVAVTTCG